MFYRPWSNILFLALLYLAPLQAAVVPHLYQATVPLASHDPKAEEAATQVGLAQVLLKVSGNAQITQIPLVSTALKKPDTYVQSLSTLANAQAKIDFDPAAVDQLIEQAHQTVWPAQRPAVVFWLAIDRGQGATLIGSSMADPIITGITTEASVRGLPVLFPMLDLQDLNAVQVNDVTQKTISVIQSASSRYAGDAELIGQISQANSMWTGQWTLVSDNKPQVDWSTTAPDLNTLVTGLVDDITNKVLVQSPISASASQNTVMLYVSPVNGLDAYARVLDYVNGLRAVKSAQVVQQKGDELEIQLTTAGGAAAVQQAIASDQKLIPILGSQDAVQSTQPTSNLHYQWAG